MRIDHLLVSEPLRERVIAAEIDREARKGKPVPSDHAPLFVDLDTPGRAGRRRLGVGRGAHRRAPGALSPAAPDLRVADGGRSRSDVRRRIASPALAQGPGCRYHRAPIEAAG